MDRGCTGILLAGIFLLMAANHASASILHNKTCGTNLRLDCGNAPIIILIVTSNDRLTKACRPGSDGAKKVTIDQVREKCEGKRECDFVTGFNQEDMRYLDVYYDCGQSYDICSDVTIQANNSYLNLVDQAGVPGPSKCSCEARVPPGSAVSVKIISHKFRSPETVLTLKWRDDTTFYINQTTPVTITPLTHVVVNRFKVEYKTEVGNNKLLLHYEVAEPIKMVCNNGSENRPAPAPGPRPGTGSGPRPGEETSTVELGKEEEEKPPIGAIVGGVIAVIVVVVVVVVLVVFFVKRRRRTKGQPKDQTITETKNNYEGDVEAAECETLTKKTGSEEQTVGSGKGDPVSEKEGQDTPVYESITNYKDGEKRDIGELPSPKHESIELHKPLGSTEEPEGARADAKHTTSFSVSDSDLGGDYVMVEDDKKGYSEDGDKKGFMGWLGKTLGFGAKRKESELDKKESVKSKEESSRGGEQKVSSDVPEGDNDRLYQPLLPHPDFMPKSPVSPEYDRIDRTKDSVKSNEFNFDDNAPSGEGGNSPNVYEEFPHKILPSAKLAKAKHT